MEPVEPQQPHVLFLPFPAQGHIKPMLSLAQLLCQAKFQVTFLNSDHNHNLFISAADLPALQARFPGLRFQSISDGLPPEHPRTYPSDADLFFSTRSVTRPLLRELLISLRNQAPGKCSPPNCIIADGYMCFAIDVAEELQIPIFTFHTQSAHALWVHFQVRKLVDLGEVPLSGKDMNEPVNCIPGLEKALRRRDLPSTCRLPKNDPILEFFISETLAMPRASALIINTFDELESLMISKLRCFFPKIYPVGPLHAHLDARLNGAPASTKGTLWKEDRDCLTWLDSQPMRSVVFVSFGSLVGFTSNQMLEFWHGLVNSGKKFLWVIRPDSITGEDEACQTILKELEERSEGKGLMVRWAPQEEVLAHPAIGGFLTHSGWNSTLESISARVPMICWPQAADQQVNGRCVSHVWKIGLGMDTCNRSTVEMMVRDLMEKKTDGIMKSIAEIAGMAHDCVKENGSSHRYLEKLIEDMHTIIESKESM